MSDGLRKQIFVLAALAVALVAFAAPAPAARALEARFLVNGGHRYTRDARVSAGDEGWTPFFRPGVVVWDGGSIIAGHRADPGYEFPTQTLAIVPRVVQSFVSSSPSAKIADMLAEAPDEVDARYAEDADLNVCVVQAGGGDFRLGASAAAVYTSLRTYCLERRGAGFRVVVLSVLPTDRPSTFPATRMAFNTMLRGGWKLFADGLADIAADDRIGDEGDEFDSQFYLSDQLHLTDAGQTVMASVTAPVLCGLPWTSARCELRLRDVPGAWTDWRPWTASTGLWLDDYQGAHLVEAEYRLDGGRAVEVSDTVFLDTVRPAPRVLRPAVGWRGARASLRFEVDDPEPCGPTSTALIQVKTTSGRTVRSWMRRSVPVNEPATLSFACSLPRGSYRWFVSARDTAGNVAATPAKGVLYVR